MIDLKTTFSDIRKTMALSVACHILLALLLLIIGTGFDFDNREFAEVAFIGGTRTSPSPVKEEPARAVIREQPKPESAKESIPDKPTESTTRQKEQVELPKRRMMEQEETEPLPRESEKLTPTAERLTDSNKRKVLNENHYEGREIAESIPGDRVTAGTSKIPQSSKELAPSQDIGGPTTIEPFFIEGDVAQRKIEKKIIPKYPAGLQKEATVKIRFTVLPDGRVGEMIPLLKGGDATLEQTTMNALRQWRFNPLSPSAPQVRVQGIITFNYLLR